MDLSSLKIINSRAIDPININTVVDESPNLCKEDYGSVRPEGQVWKLCEDGKFQN